MPTHDELGLRMKNFYESVPKTSLMRRTPVAIRIDGKAFHTFTRGFEKPFDEVLGRAMRETMKYLCENIQGCVLGYTQSDEITLILVDYKKLTSSAWFDYEVQKMCSIAASMATMAFNKAFEKELNKWKTQNFPTNYLGHLNAPVTVDTVKLLETYHKAIDKGAMFDARCFNIPKEEVANLIYWRQLDAARNSIQMVGQAYFSHSELHGKNQNDIQEMLWSTHGINWNDYSTHLKRGSCCIKVGQKTTCAEENLDGTVNTWTIERPHWEIDLNIPMFKGINRKYINDLIDYEEDYVIF
jgi:tRNA(His) 5'-end guanylyltransferase